LHRPAAQALEGFARGRGLELRTPLRFLDGLADRIEGKEARLDLGQRPQDARLRVVLLVHPEPGEGSFGGDESQVVGSVLLVDVFEEMLGRLQRGHEQRAVGNSQPVDGLKPVPRPGLHALGERVVDADGGVDLVGLVARHVLLELLDGVCHDREVLGGDAVALRAVAVATEGDAPPAGLAGGEDDASTDPSGEILLEDTAVDDLAGEMRHRSSSSFGPAGLRWLPGPDRARTGPNGQVVRPDYAACSGACQSRNTTSRTGRCYPAACSTMVAKKRCTVGSSVSSGGKAVTTTVPCRAITISPSCRASAATPEPSRLMRGARMKTILIDVGPSPRSASPSVSKLSF